MIPSWARRAAFAGVLLHAAVGLALTAHPDACADVWVAEHYVSACCDLSAHTRWHAPGHDCCSPGGVEDRDPGAFATTATVAPAAVVGLVSPQIAAAPVVRAPAPDASIPERPPDRALRVTVLQL